MLIYGSSLLILLASVAAYFVSRREIARAQRMLERGERSKTIVSLSRSTANKRQAVRTTVGSLSRRNRPGRSESFGTRQ